MTAPHAQSTPDISIEFGSCGLCKAIDYCPFSIIGKQIGVGQKELLASVQTISARKMICYPNEFPEFVSVICNGWAATSVSLSDSRRQILSFLVSGDVFFVSTLFKPMSGRQIEAITDVTYRSFKCRDIKTALFKHPDMFELLAKVWAEEQEQSDQLAVDLGRRTAEERIARLILNLLDKLAKRGMAQDLTMGFPLRQHHIADAAGLTPVHVSRVLTKFRRSGLIGFAKRLLTVVDLPSLRRIAGTH